MGKCVNCNEDTNNKVLNSCGHYEYLCEECCNVCDNVEGISICKDKCLICTLDT